MLKRFGALAAVLVLLGFGLVGLAQSAPDGSASYPSPPEGTEPSPQFVYCRWEAWIPFCSAWEYAYTEVRCNWTHRCWGKGCYHVFFYARTCEVYQRYCCYSWPSGDVIGCGPWQGPEYRTETRDLARAFLRCGCGPLNPCPSAP